MLQICHVFFLLQQISTNFAPKLGITLIKPRLTVLIFVTPITKGVLQPL